MKVNRSSPATITLGLDKRISVYRRGKKRIECIASRLDNSHVRYVFGLCFFLYLSLSFFSVQFGLFVSSVFFSFRFFVFFFYFLYNNNNIINARSLFTARWARQTAHAFPSAETIQCRNHGSDRLTRISSRRICPSDPDWAQKSVCFTDTWPPFFQSIPRQEKKQVKVSAKISLFFLFS